MADRGLRPERVWWCPLCGPSTETVSESYPGACLHCFGPRESLGFRVGEWRGAYAYYSTKENAMRDRRVK